MTDANQRRVWLYALLLLAVCLGAFAFGMWLMR
jgi:hypothetical protein